MAKRSPRPLDRQGFEIRFFEGDITRLREILSPRDIEVSKFIRELVSKTIRRIEDRSSQARVAHEPVPDIELDETQMAEAENLGT